MDSKAKVKIGEFSRNGKVRIRDFRKAADHDMNPSAKLVPFGIFDVRGGALSIFFGTSAETSDFTADCVEMWWDANRLFYRHIKELVINTDCGPNTAGNRTQFLRRMTEFSDKSGLKIRLAYYPPYHSKYNPIERCWGALERHRNGEILNSVEKAIGWAGTMTWRGIRPVVRMCNKIYQKGITLTKKEMRPYEERIQRSEKLPLWDILIRPV
jgi:ribosome modulation factor